VILRASTGSATAGREADRAQGRPGTSAASRDPVVRPARAAARGKFLYAGDEKIYVKGVTYGTFRPDDAGREFTDGEVVARDL